MNMNITIVAPELANALNNLAFALETRNLLKDTPNPLDGVNKPLETSVPKEEKKETAKEEKPKAETPKEEPKQEEKPEPVKAETTSGITLDVITTKTREFIQADKANRVKLKEFLDSKGAPKVSELDPADFQAALDFFEAQAK